MSNQPVIIHQADNTAADPISVLAQVMPLLLSAAGYPNTGKCVGWVLGMIASGDEHIDEQLADMDHKLDTISEQIDVLERRFEEAIKRILDETRRQHWEGMVNHMKPHVSRIETVYQRVQGLARLEDREEARKQIPKVRDAILDPTTGIEYALQTIHDLTMDAVGTNGFLATWSEQAHDAAHKEWKKQYRQAAKKGGDPWEMHADLSAEMNAFARDQVLAQTEAVFAYLVGAQMKALVLLCEAAHADSMDDSDRAPTMFDYYVERYQSLMRKQCMFYWQIVEELTHRFAYFAFVCWGTSAANEGYQRLARADRLVAAALGLESAVVIRCNWHPSMFTHRNLKPGHTYLASTDPVLLLTDGDQQFSAESIYNTCPQIDYPVDKEDKEYDDNKVVNATLPKVLRRWVFENLPNGTYWLDSENNHAAPTLKLIGSQAEARGKVFINPTYLEIPLAIERPDDAVLKPDVDSSRYHLSLNFRGYGPSELSMFSRLVASGAQMAYAEEALVIELMLIQGYDQNVI
jgi:hypothetical protein